MKDEITYRILKCIEENPNQSQRELSRSLGVSLGRMNYCLHALMDAGLVKARNFYDNPNKSGYLYLLTPKGVEEKGRVTRRFLQRRMQEYEQIKSEIARLQEETRNDKLP
jgi:EPS-associated MarR family transcriptional regulator